MSNRLEFATTPPGVLQDYQALEIETHFDSAPEELKPALAAKLANYKAFRSQFPKPLTDEEHEKRAEEFRTLTGLAEDWEGTRTKMPAEKAAALEMSKAPDPEYAKRSAWNMGYLAHEIGEPIADTADYERKRRAWAQTNFGGVGAEDDVAFHGQAKAAVLKRRDENTAVTELGAQAIQAAQAGKGYRETFAKWAKESVGKPGVDPTHAAAYAAAGQEVYNETLERTDSHADLIGDILDVMEKRTGSGKKEKVGATFDLETGEQIGSGEPDLDALVERVISGGYSRAEIDFILAATAAKAEQAGHEPKKMFQQFGESLIRGGEDIVHGFGAAGARETLQSVKTLATVAATAQAALGIGPPDYLAGKVGEIDRQLRKVELAERLRRFGDQQVDPVKSLAPGWLGKLDAGIYGMANTISSLVSINPAGAVALAASQSNGVYMDLREKYPGMTEAQAQAIATPAGAIMGALDRVEAMIAFGAPTVVGKAASARFRDWVAGSLVKRVGTAVGAEFATEMVQNFTPLAVQELEAQFSKQIPDPAFWEEMKPLLAQAPETFIAILPLAGLAGPMGQIADRKAAASLLNNAPTMRLAGLSEEGIAEITKLASEGKVEQAREALQKQWATRDKMTPVADAAGPALEEARTEAAVIQSRALQAGVTISREADGWRVRDGEGNETSHADFGEAFQSFRQAANESEVRRDEPFLGAIEEYSRGSLTGESFEVRKEGRSLAAALAAAEIEEDQNTIDAIWARVELERAKRGKPDLMPEDLRVLGDSKPDYAKATAEYAARVWDGADVLDLVEEKAHNDVNRWVREGRTTMAKLAEMIRAVEAATGDTYLRGEGDVAIHEAYADLARTYATGQRRGGAVTKGARGQQATGARTLRNKLREARDNGTAVPVMKALSDTWEFFKGVLTQARRLGKAKAAGKLGDVEQFLTESVGLSEQQAHNEAVAKEFGLSEPNKEAQTSPGLGTATQAPPSNAPKSGPGTTVGDFLAEVKADTGAINNAEEARASLAPLVGKDLTTADGGITANISKNSIGKMVSGSAVQKSASPAAHFAAISEFEKLFEASVITESKPDRDADPNIRAIHRTVARMAAGGKPYDVQFTVKELAGVDGNRIYSIEAMEIGDAPERKRVAAYPASGPTSTPQSEASPKDSTDDRAGQGAFSLASADYLEALAPQLQAKGRPPRERRAMYQKAQEQVAGMARAMRFNDETGKPPDRKEMLRSLATLDAILMAFPPEVRGKVGGFTKLASLQTNKAREAFLRGRIEKLDKVLESYLRREYTDELQKILDRAKPTKDQAGQKKVGKAGAEIHDLFNVLRDAVGWDADKVAAHVAGLEAQIAAGNMSPEAEAMAELEAQLVPLVGDWANADAARMAAAVEAVDATLAGGLLAWQAKKLQQREERKATRESLMADTGNLGSREERVAEAERESGVKGWLRRKMLSLSSFEELTRFIFGKDSAKAKELVTREREASNAKEDELDTMGQGLSDLFTKLAGAPLAGEKLRFGMAQRTLDGKQAGKMSPFEAIQATLMWRQPDGQRHMIGKIDENGKPTGPWHYDQAWIDHIEAQLSPEAKAVREYISEDYGKEWATLNPLYQERHGVSLPRNLNYAPLTVTPQQAQAGQMTDPVSGIAMTGTSITPGSLRTRSRGAVAEPDFRDALQTFIAHKKQMAHWKAYGALATDMSAILGNRELGNTVEGKGGEQARKVLAGWVDQFAQGGTRDAQAQLDLSQGIERALGRSAGAALIGRASVLMIQSTQLAAAAVEMPVGTYVRRMGKLLTGNLGWKEALDSDFIQRRMKQMPPLVRQAMQGLRTGKPSALKHQIARLGTLISGADGLFTAGTYAILLDYHKQKAKEAGLYGAAADSYAHAAAEEGTERVAQPTRPGARSLYENTTTNPLGRAAWMFGSEARQKIMLAGWAAADWKKNPKRAAKAIALAWGVGGVGATILRNAWRDLRDDDDDELFDEKNWSAKRMALAAATGPLQGIPVLGDAIEGGIGKLLGEAQPEGGILGGMTDAGRALRSLASGQAFEDDEPIETTVRRVESLLSGLAMTNDSIAAAASVAHVVTDILRITDALKDDREEVGAKQLAKEAREEKEAALEAMTEDLEDAKSEAAKARKAARIEAAAQRAGEK